LPAVQDSSARDGSALDDVLCTAEHLIDRTNNPVLIAFREDLQNFAWPLPPLMLTHRHRRATVMASADIAIHASVSARKRHGYRPPPA
jgi:hypothetical protein